MKSSMLKKKKIHDSVTNSLQSVPLSFIVFMPIIIVLQTCLGSLNMSIVCILQKTSHLFIHVATAHIVTKMCFQRCNTGSQLVSKGRVDEKVRSAPLGSSLLSCWRHQQWVIHSPHLDFAHFKRLLALAQQKRLLLSVGDGTDGWQESAKDANRLWSHRAASALLWPSAIARSNCELDLV